jgi:hypothetical protein
MVGEEDRCGDWEVRSWEGIGFVVVRNDFEEGLEKRICIFLVGELNARTFAVHIAK